MNTPSMAAARPLVWFITGTSQGFGRALVHAALERGDSVVATSRNPELVTSAFPAAGARLAAIPMDFSDSSQIAAAVQTAVGRFGRIDVLVNNAGHGLLGAVEEASDAEIAKVYEINVFGLMRVTRAVLPQLRKQRSGHIVNLSSIGGLAPTPGWGIYNSTKFAIEGLSEALAQEVAPLGIHVLLVEPGPFRTDFLGGSLSVAAKTIDDYAATAGQTRLARDGRNGTQPGDPGRGAAAIIKAITADNPPLRLLLGGYAYERATTKLGKLSKEFEAWRAVTLATDFEP